MDMLSLLIVLFVPIILFSLFLQIRSAKKQKENLNSVAESIELQKKGIQYQIERLELSKENNRLLREFLEEIKKRRI
jgi:competence protein ComGC